MFWPLEKNPLGGGVAGGTRHLLKAPPRHCSLQLPHKTRRVFPRRGKSTDRVGVWIRKTDEERHSTFGYSLSVPRGVLATKKRTVRWKKLILGSKWQRIWEPGGQDSFRLLRIGSLLRTLTLLCQPGVPCCYRIWHTLGLGATVCCLPQRSLFASFSFPFLYFSEWFFPCLLVHHPSPPFCRPGFVPLLGIGGMAEVKFTISFIDCKKVRSHVWKGPLRTGRGMDRTWVWWVLRPPSNLYSSLRRLWMRSRMWLPVLLGRCMVWRRQWQQSWLMVANVIKSDKGIFENVWIRRKLCVQAGQAEEYNWRLLLFVLSSDATRDSSIYNMIPSLYRASYWICSGHLTANLWLPLSALDGQKILSLNTWTRRHGVYCHLEWALVLGLKNVGADK